jgi:molybdopterin-containing oxidoreductase family membrane subunit
MMWNRLTGPYRYHYFALILCNVLAPQFLWVARFRRSVGVLFTISIIVSIGMWLERFIIIPVSLHRDFMPGAWGMYHPTGFDWSTFLGTLGLFFCMLFLFLRLLPMISIFEMRTMVPPAEAKVAK